MSMNESIDTTRISAICKRGLVEDWKTYITRDYSRECYLVRTFLTFSDGSTAKREYSFKTRKEATLKEKEIMEQLFDGRFVIAKVRSEEYFRYWLDEYMREERNITYSTWYTYNRFLRRNIFPVLKNKWMEEITTGDISEILDKATTGTLSPLYGALNSAFKYALKMNLVSFNCAQTAIAMKRKSELKRISDEAAKETRSSNSKNRRKTNGKRIYTLSVKQTSDLLLLAREKYPKIFLPLLLSCTTGCRISEVCAIRYGDVNFETKTIQITGQLGKSFESINLPKGAGRTTQRIKAKSENGVRTIPVADFVLDEIAASRSAWENSDVAINKNIGDITVWHKENGNSYGRSAYTKDFKFLKKDFGLPDDFHWHDLRHAYATIMVDNKANLKELATVLGHSSGKFTMEHYVITDMPIREEIGVYKTLFEDVLPITVENGTIVSKESTICEVNGFCTFMQELICSCLADTDE